MSEPPLTRSLALLASPNRIAGEKRRARSSKRCGSLCSGRDMMMDRAELMEGING